MLALRETLLFVPPLLNARMRHDSPIIERNSVPDRLTAPRATVVGAEYASLANVYERDLCN